MLQIFYHTAKRLEPLGTNNFATTYFKINNEERYKLQSHIQEVLMSVALAFQNNPEANVWIESPLKKFNRTKGENYSLVDIVTDLNDQLLSGKDVPSGMLGRWNRLFKDTEWDFEMVMRRKESKAEKIVMEDIRAKMFKEKDNE